MRIIFSPEATREVMDAYKYYKDIDSELALRFKNILEMSANHIRNNPKGHPIVYKHFRRKLISEFPYALFYSIEPGEIRVFALLHQRRHFQRWLKKRG